MYKPTIQCIILIIGIVIVFTNGCKNRAFLTKKTNFKCQPINKSTKP